MKQRDLANLLNRAAAAIENPSDLSDRERVDVVEDLVEAAEECGHCGLMLYVGGICWTCVRPLGHDHAHADDQGHTWENYCGAVAPGSWGGGAPTCSLEPYHTGNHRSGHGTEWENTKCPSPPN